MKEKKIKVIYISGLGRSGSTLLDLIISTSDKVFSIGEAYRLKSYLDREYDCSCGDKMELCSFWSKLYQKLRTFSIKNRVSTRNYFKIAYSLYNPFYTEKFQFKSDNEDLFSLIKKNAPTETEYILDSSKELGRLIELNEDKSIEVYNINVIRDGQGAANSFNTRTSQAKGKSYFISIFKWILMNALINKYLKKANVRSLAISYNLFCKDPAKYLNQINQFLKIYIPSDYISVIKDMNYHNLGGNKLARLENRQKFSEIKEDNKWRTQQNKFKKFLSTLICYIFNKRWVYRQKHKTIKICFISPKAYQVFNPKIKTTFGGAEVQMSLLSKEFAKNKKIDVNFIVADYGQEKLEYFNGVKVWKSINFKTNIFKQIFVFLKVFRGIDATIHIQRSLSPFSGIIAIICSLQKKKFVYMMSHDSESDLTHALFDSWIGGKLARITFRKANLVIAQNDYQKTNLKKNFNIYATLIKSGHEIPEQNLKPREYILWVARSEKWKRPEVLFEIAKRFPDEEFVMISQPATNEPEYSIKIQDKANQIKNIKFIPFVPFEKICEPYSKAKLFLCTSKQEGFANTYIDASRNSVPILSLNVNPNNIFENYQMGYCAKGDLDKLCEKINLILDNQQVLERMGQNAYQYAHKNHNIEVVSQILLNQVLESSGKSL